jgi:hypothetical protein
MSIGELAGRSRLSPKALRLYDELELLPPAGLRLRGSDRRVALAGEIVVADVDPVARQRPPCPARSAPECRQPGAHVHATEPHELGARRLAPDDGHEVQVAASGMKGTQAHRPTT